MKREKLSGSLFSFMRKGKAVRSFGPAAMFSREKESWNSPEPGAAWIDYCSYSLSSREWIQYGIAGFLLAAVINFLFFRQRIAFIFLSPLILIIPLRMKKTLMERRQQELVRQFRDGALAVASALGCGYSIENAFSQAAESMSAVYGEDGYITLEFEWICSRLALNQTVEEEIRSLAVRSGQEDIRQFAEVFGAAKRSSGDLSAILQDTAELLGRKIQLR